MSKKSKWSGGIIVRAPAEEIDLLIDIANKLKNTTLVFQKKSAEKLKIVEKEGSG